MTLPVIVGTSMIVVGLALTVYVIVLILNERKRDRSSLD
jgi:uncharacterized protein YoxC